MSGTATAERPKKAARSTPQKKAFKLLKGSADIGGKLFNHKGPNRDLNIVGNVVESTVDLEKRYPGKFIAYEGEVPKDFGGEPEETGEGPSPMPTTDRARAMAQLMSNMNAAEMLELADDLQERIDALREGAKQAQKANASKKRGRGPEEEEEDEPEEDKLDDYNMDELHKIAAKEGAEVTSSMHKDELVEAIRQNRKANE